MPRTTRRPRHAPGAKRRRNRRNTCALRRSHRGDGPLLCDAPFDVRDVQSCPDEGEEADQPAPIAATTGERVAFSRPQSGWLSPGAPPGIDTNPRGARRTEGTDGSMVANILILLGLVLAGTGAPGPGP